MTDVLVVDDNGAIRRTVRSILDFAGYDVCEAADGQLALEHLATHAHEHVILLDIEMPRMNGLRTLEVLAQQPAMRLRHAVIMMTASTQGMLPAFAHVPVLRKPFDIDVLIASVERAERLLMASCFAAS